jgi:class 3 adenylate cyclase/pimeloyl-ACP methyl ester carboxylesterase
VVRYVGEAGSAIAYQVWGNGPTDILIITEYGTSVDGVWSHPGQVRTLRFLGSIGRTIRFDPRGLGSSDHLAGEEVAKLDSIVDDALVVLNEVDATHVSIVGEGFMAQVAIRLSAEHPGRVDRLMLWNGFARLSRAADYPLGPDEEAMSGVARSVVGSAWGTGQVLESFVPTLVSGATDPDAPGRSERSGATREVAATMAEAQWHADIRYLLDSVSVPTLVVYTGDFLHIEEDHVRYLAEHLPDGRYLEAPSTSFYYGEQGLSEIGAFLGAHATDTGLRRVASVLFTDIVGSTEVAAAKGDRAWSEALDGFDAFVEVQAGRFDGRIVKQTGDGHMFEFGSPRKAIEASMNLIRSVSTFGVVIRAGIHTGEVEERRGGDLSGTTINVAARVCSQADPGQLWVSRTVADLVVGGDFALDDRGEHTLKGVQGTWRLFSVTP